MFINLDTSHYSRVAPLFEPLSHNLSIAAVIKGNNNAWIYY
jgi:hypothetical protein